MLDIAFIRQQPDAVKAGIARKLADPTLVDTALELDTSRRKLLHEIETRQSRLNTISEEISKSHGQQKIDLINEAAPLSQYVKKARPELEKVEAEYMAVMLQIPNIPDADVPDGASDKENVIVRHEGAKPEFSFAPKSHVELMENLDLVDFNQAAKVAGHKFYYLKNEAVILEMALLRYAMDTLMQKGFTPMTPPDLVRYEAMVGAAHFPPDDDAYKLPEDGLYLAGTAEVGLVNYHAGQALPEEVLPLRYAGYSACFRREAGAHGKKGGGLYRIHQFHKIEMVSIVRPEDATAEHELLLAIAEEMLAALGLHYRVVLNCGGDLGMPQVKKWDIETYIPSEDEYGETHSCSNDTDYQARRLGIKIKRSKGGETQTSKQSAYVFTLNNTAFASPRILIPLIENYQQADGSIAIPDVLVPYTGFKKIELH